MDPQGSENTIQEFQIKTEILEDSVNECLIRNRISEKPLQEPLIKQEISDDPCDENYVEFEITENPIKIEVADKNYLAVTPQEEDDMLPKDPLEPTLRNRPLGPDAKLMLLNVIRYFQKLKLKREKETGVPDKLNVNLTVAEATGVSESAVKSLLNKYRHKGVEAAIGSAKKNSRKRKADTKISEGDEEATATVTTKNKQKKP